MFDTQEAAQGGPGNATDDRGRRWYHTAATTVGGPQEPSSSSIHQFQRSESMATSSKTYPNEDAARRAVETLRVASVPPREIRLLSSRPLPTSAANRSAASPDRSARTLPSPPSRAARTGAATTPAASPAMPTNSDRAPSATWNAS